MTRTLTLVHVTDDGKWHECRPEQRKRASLFPKWFCTQCNRYVLPDNVHRTIMVKKLEPR